MSRDALESGEAELVLRYAKHRWSPAVGRVLAADEPLEAARLADLDLDHDLPELERAVGRAALERLAEALLGLDAPLDEGARARRALAPEVVGPRADAVLALVGLNLAFRLRTDGLLLALVTAAGARTAPRPPAELVARLLARARSARDARALAGLAPAPEALRDAVVAAVPAPGPPAAGERLHVDATHDVIEKALAQALKPLVAGRFSAPGPEARRFLLLRRRGGWVTVLAERDAIEADLAVRLARTGGVRRVAWAREAPTPDLQVHEGSRLVLDLPGLAARVAPDPVQADDVAGALRALGVFDLDPHHPRGAVSLSFAEHVESGPPLGAERRLRQEGARPLCFDVKPA